MAFFNNSIFCHSCLRIRNFLTLKSSVKTTHSDPGSLDPQLVQENTAAQIVIDLFEGLIWLDENGQVQPAQAENGQSLTMARFIPFHCVMQNGRTVHQ